MKTLITISVFYVTLLIQTTVFDFFTLGGIKPDLVLIVVMYFALFHNTKAALGAAMVMGLLADILSGGFIGINLLNKSLLGYLFSLFGRQIVVDNPINHGMLIFIASLLDGGLTFFILKAGYLAAPGGETLLKLILPQAFYNGLICLLLIPMLKKLYSATNKKRTTIIR